MPDQLWGSKNQENNIAMDFLWYVTECCFLYSSQRTYREISDSSKKAVNVTVQMALFLYCPLVDKGGNAANGLMKPTKIHSFVLSFLRVRVSVATWNRFTPELSIQGHRIYFILMNA